MVKHVFDKNHEPVSAQIPMFLYRYQKVDDNFFASLKESYLWFSRSSELNDPFDCANISADSTFKDLRRFLIKYGHTSPAEAGAAARAITENTDGPRGLSQQLYDDRIKFVNVCCFSTFPTVSLLWAHYADGHRGAVLIYGAPRLLTFDTSEARFAIVGVRYQRPLPKYNSIRESLKYGDSAEYNFRFDQIVLGTKSIEWSYEKETRLLSPKHGKNLFKPHALVGVICGHKMPMDVVSEVKHRVYETYPDALFFYQELDKQTNQITVPGTETFEYQTVEIKTSKWRKAN